VSVLKLNDQVQAIDIAEVLLADSISLKVVKEHQHDSNNLLPTEEIKNLRNFLDNG
jgi:hypothetical protein